MNSLQQILKTDPGILVLARAGDLVEGTVFKKEPRRVFIDLGPLGTGVVYGFEFQNAKQVIKDLKVGDKVSAKIVETDNDAGFIELSLAEADRQKVWETIRELKEKDEPISVKIAGCNSGGLITEISGLPAFLPVSQLTNEHYPRVSAGDKAKIIEELKKFAGQSLSVKIIDLNPRTSKLIISERQAFETSIKEHINKYAVGQVVDGIISGVADFGAFFRFTDNPAVEGLIHISELDHRLIDNPKEVVKVDDSVQAKIIDISPNGRISLSFKALKPDPWAKAEEKYKAGQEITGSVYKFNPFGAVIRLDGEIYGLIHVSEFGGLEEMKKKLELNGQYSFVIDSVKPEEKRLFLKLVKNK